MPIEMKNKKNISDRLFESDFLERLTHVHPITPLIFWTPVIVYLLYRGVAIHGLSMSECWALGFLGFFMWTLFEYGLHRFVFHFPAKKNWSKRLVFLFHGVHHEFPNDKTRLVMPPFPGSILAVILYYFFQLFLGSQWIDPFFGCFLIGYLCYDYIHYSVHHFTQRTRVGRYLRFHHMIHHYTDPNNRWGVSNPLWDVVFGTLGNSSEKAQESLRESRQDG